jgi:hypothetical protein
MIYLTEHFLHTCWFPSRGLMTSAFTQLSLTDNFKTFTGNTDRKHFYHLFLLLIFNFLSSGTRKWEIASHIYFKVYTSYGTFRNRKYKREKRKIIYKGINQSTNAQFKNWKASLLLISS